ncbi:uncharacterized protein LOC141590449 [Silene latifolia]|uniref:uncharacterized protein LOC141590449 n=1 Tax=Silene latifolia TaxID=37657 RepID=UPI003D76E3A2
MATPENNQVIEPTPKPPSYTYVTVENPNTNITQILFNGANFNEWSRGLTLALLAKGKLGYVDGTIPKPATTAAEFEPWRSQNALVTAWLYNSLEPPIRRTISYRPEAKQMWVDIPLTAANTRKYADVNLVLTIVLIACSRTRLIIIIICIERN